MQSCNLMEWLHLVHSRLFEGVLSSNINVLCLYWPSPSNQNFYIMRIAGYQRGASAHRVGQ